MYKVKYTSKERTILLLSAIGLTGSFILIGFFFDWYLAAYMYLMTYSSNTMWKIVLTNRKHSIIRRIDLCERRLAANDERHRMEMH